MIKPKFMLILALASMTIVSVFLAGCSSTGGGSQPAGHANTYVLKKSSVPNTFELTIKPDPKDAYGAVTQSVELRIKAAKTREKVTTSVVQSGADQAKFTITVQTTGPHPPPPPSSVTVTINSGN